ncbi:MAG: hypothetical protein HOP19_23035 [Acidobacteria bacterium]|nr:hypothetical protein [Acidobacteriota bacterium]
MTESSERFRHFAAHTLEHAGALVEAIEPAGIEAMLPDELQRAWRAPEFLRLGFGSEIPAAAERASLESIWLERFGELLGASGQQLCYAIQPQAPAPSLERLIEHHVELPNAVYRILSSETAWTRYVLFVFRYTAMSEEKREGIIRLGFNLANGSALDPFIDVLFDAALAADTAPAVTPPALNQLPADWAAAKWQKALSRTLPAHVNHHLAPFVSGMQRRLERDLERIHDYFSGLRLEAWRKLQKAKGDTAREQLRIEAAEREYQAKVVDLKQKYDLRVTLELVQTLELRSPVHRVTLLIKRRKGERKLTLDWNPLARQLDPMPCEWSFAAHGPRMVCDDKLHIVSLAGHAACAECGKEYCRVCSPRRCPKCGREDGSDAKP